jgi:hypothetical protein
MTAMKKQKSNDGIPGLFILGALIYLVASRYQEIVAYTYEFTIFTALNFSAVQGNSYSP